MLAGRPPGSPRDSNGVVPHGLPSGLAVRCRRWWKGLSCEAAAALRRAERQQGEPAPHAEDGGLKMAFGRRRRAGRGRLEQRQTGRRQNEVAREVFGARPLAITADTVESESLGDPGQPPAGEAPAVTGCRLPPRGDHRYCVFLRVEDRACGEATTGRPGPLAEGNQSRCWPASGAAVHARMQAPRPDDPPGPWAWPCPVRAAQVWLCTLLLLVLMHRFN